MRKSIGIVVLVASVLFGMYLTCFLGDCIHYSQCIVSEEQFADIIAVRTETEGLLTALIFDEETLFYDEGSKTFYYSLVEGNSSAYDPEMKILSKDAGVGIAFLEDRITVDGIAYNQTIDFLVYTDEAYCGYGLKCTTLPLMDIECQGIGNPEEIADEPVSMNITVFDNQLGAINRLVLSDGTIQIRGGSTRGYPKRGYDISLTQKSMGYNIRDNDRALLGMRQDDDWVLYAAYNDQEKIRNVFSCKLWKNACATDNARGIDTGVEYRYLELFMNGEYWGLYALGYKIDKKQLQADVRNGREALYKVITWADRGNIEAAGAKGYETRGMEASEDWAQMLMEYYGRLPMDASANEQLYAGIDIDNAIDIYLFYNLIQGGDHVAVNLVKNLYVLIRREEDGRLTALYAPWDMDITWGNLWEREARLFTVPYGISTDVNYVMESGYLNQLIVNGDLEICRKISEKYQYLRATAWSEEKINGMLNEFEAIIYGSGAYLRDMERWPEGIYADAENGLDTFRAYVMARLQECDAYYERQELLYNESVFVRRSAQYKDFLESSFIIEVNDRVLLNDPDYIALFEYMGVDIASITDEVCFIIGNALNGRYDYLSSLVEEGESRLTSAGTVSFTTVRDGVYEVALDGVKCYNTTLFSRPDIRMAVIREGTVQEFSFVKGYGIQFVPDAFMDLSVYLEALSATGYQAVIEINNPDIWNDSNYVSLFGKLGLSEESIDKTTDFIIWNGLEKEVFALDNFHGSGNRFDAPGGYRYSLFINEDDIYGIYLNDEELFLSSEDDRAVKDVRILLVDSNSCELVESITFGVS